MITDAERILGFSPGSFQSSNGHSAPNFSPGKALKGMTAEDAQRVVDEAVAKWANPPEVVVVDSMDDPRVPQSVRDYDAAARKHQKKSNPPEGFLHDGIAYIVAGALRSPGKVEVILYHESLGHYGLRGMFGEKLTPILQQIVGLRRGEVIEKAAEYGLAASMEHAREFVHAEQPTLSGAALETAARTRLHSDSLMAAEEVLAELAQRKPEITGLHRVVAVIRGFLRKYVPGFKTMAMTDEDMLANYIVPAREFVERGRKG